MSTPDIANILRVPGKLCHSPSDLSTAYPHGGTAIGSVGRINLRPIDTPFPITSEELGGAVIDLVEGGAKWLLDVELREYDADALAILFPFYAAGAKGGAILKLTANTAAYRAGVSVAGLLSRVLVFSPDNADAHPFVIFRRAVPAIQDTAMLAFRGNASVGIAARWYATPDSSFNVIDVGLRRDLTL